MFLQFLISYSNLNLPKLPIFLLFLLPTSISCLMDEPKTEFLRVVDPQTQGTIVCANHHHIGSPKWRTKYLCNSNEEDDENNIFDLSSHHPCGNTKTFSCRAVNIGAERPWIELLVDYACEMHRTLSNEGEVVVHCATGINCPTLILAFFLLRGFDRLHTMEWLTKAFKTQRPTVASRSAARSVQFPNFGNFENVLFALENSLQQPWLRSRIGINARYLSPSSSRSTTTITYKQLHGEPWTKTLVVPTRTSASALPTSSYCPPLVVVGRATGDESMLNRKKSVRIHRKKNETKEKKEENFLAWSPMVGARILVKSTGRKRDGTKEDGSVGTLVEKLAAAEWRVGAFCLFIWTKNYFYFFLLLLLLPIFLDTCLTINFDLFLLFGFFPQQTWMMVRPASTWDLNELHPRSPLGCALLWIGIKMESGGTVLLQSGVVPHFFTKYGLMRINVSSRREVH